MEQFLGRCGRSRVVVCLPLLTREKEPSGRSDPPGERPTGHVRLGRADSAPASKAAGGPDGRTPCPTVILTYVKMYIYLQAGLATAKKKRPGPAGPDRPPASGARVPEKDPGDHRAKPIRDPGRLRQVVQPHPPDHVPPLDPALLTLHGTPPSWKERSRLPDRSPGGGTSPVLPPSPPPLPGRPSAG